MFRGFRGDSHDGKTRRRPAHHAPRRMTLEDARRDAQGKEAGIVSFYRVRETGDFIAVRARGELLEIACRIRFDDQAFVCHAHGLEPKAWGNIEAVAPGKVPVAEQDHLYRALLGDEYGKGDDINF